MNFALILAGGSGVRTGKSLPKQYLEAAGKPMIAYVLDVFETHPDIDGLHIVAESCYWDYLKGFLRDGFKGFSEPGETRQLSVLNGLEDMKQYAGDEDVVIIHDAARPFVSKELISACLEGCREHEGVMPVLPVKDTVYLSDGERITSLLDRSQVYAGQAPEAFRFGSYYESNKSLLPERILAVNGSSEPAVMAGLDVAVIPGDEENWKVTSQTDLERFIQKVSEN